MTYCTIPDLVIRFGSRELIDLSDDDQTGAINEAVVGQVLADVAARIDGYLSDRYSLPLPQIPAGLVPIACDMARCMLAGRNNAVQPTETMQARFDDAISYLEKVAAGRVGLGLTMAGVEERSTGVSRGSGHRVYDDETLRAFEHPHSW